MFSLRTTINRVCLAGLALSMMMSAAAPQAKAIVSESKFFAQYQNRKTELLVKERDLQQDLDDLQKEIDRLNLRKDRSLSGQINDLSRSLDGKYYDLRQVRDDIHELNLRML